MSACLFVGGVADDGVLEWHIRKPLALAPVMCDVRDERAFAEAYPVEIYRRVNARVFSSLPPGEGCCPYCGRAEKVGQVLLSCGACGGLACAECVARCCTPGCPEPRESFDPNQPNTETP